MISLIGINSCAKILFGLKLYSFSFQVITSLWTASSITTYILLLASSCSCRIPSSSGMGASSIISSTLIQFGWQICYISSSSFLTASNYVHIIMPFPSGLLIYYFCFLKVILLNLFIAIYLLPTVLVQSLILQKEPLASWLFLLIMVYWWVRPWRTAFPY